YVGAFIDFAGPSVPVQIIGFKVSPEVGDVLDLSKESTATEIDVKKKRVEQTGADKASIADSMDTPDEEGKKTLNVIVKADVLGSLEAIIASLSKIKHPEVGVKIVGKGLGNINEDDAKRARDAHAHIIGFNVIPTGVAKDIIREEEIPFTEYSVIYNVINWVKEELGKLLSDEKIVTEVGTLKVLAIFRKEKDSMIVGGRVEAGKAIKISLARIKREGLVIGKGRISDCKLGQGSVKEVGQGTECGLKFEGTTRIEVGDVLELYTEETKAREIVFDK
ncbi:MAG TPA: hypothetical protein PK295_04490, partial [Candidatus Magasanikbacteria bacterium]|nr:hypothetical protein [Candidatus Magasanikbacteria bacterium]